MMTIKQFTTVKKFLTTVAAATLAGSGLLVVAPTAAQAAPRHCAGWTTHPDTYHGGKVGFQAGAVLRSGPYKDCDQVGRAGANHRMDLHCAVLNGNDVVWLWVRDLDTGRAGWIHNTDIRALTTDWREAAEIGRSVKSCYA